jgi:ketosteroid isomerase-like protein
MKNIIKTTIASIAIGASSMAFANEVDGVNHVQPSASGSVTNNSSRDSERKRVLDMVQMYTRSVNEGDVHPELIENLWEHSPDVSDINIRGHQKGYEDIKQNFYAPIFAALKDRNLRMVTDQRQPSIYFFDNTAVVEFYWRLDAVTKKDNKAISAEGRETHVLRKKEGEWKLVHLHYSGMPIKQF